jgi:hypothetical protein
MKELWEFTKTYLSPFLSGTFKLALEVVGTAVAVLVNAFATLVSLITKAFNAFKSFADLIKNNPLTNLFDDGSKGLKAGGKIIEPDLKPNLPKVSTAPIIVGGYDISGLSDQMQAAILRREELKAETERLRKAREERTNERAVTININGAIDKEGTARQIVEILNDSSYRGTGGANGLVLA